MEKWSFQRTRELMTPRALRGMPVNEVGRARISMMVQSMGSNSRPDTLVQDRTPQPHRFLLQRTAGPYIGVKRFQTIYHYSVMSLAGSCFSSESAPRPLYGAFLVKRFKQGGASFFLRQLFCSIGKSVSSSRSGLRSRRRAQARSRFAVASTLRHAPPLLG